MDRADELRAEHVSEIGGNGCEFRPPYMDAITQMQATNSARIFQSAANDASS